MIKEKTWDEFRSTGLALFVNSFLHIFGWAIVFNVDENGKVAGVFPARVRFRGFDGESVSEAHKMLATYVSANHADLKDEANQ